MRPRSDDLRLRILDAVDNHEGSQRELAERFAVDPSTITGLLQRRRRTGSASPRPHGGGEPPDARLITDLRPPARKARDVYVYFDNDRKAYAPDDARRLRQRLGLQREERL